MGKKIEKKLIFIINRTSEKRTFLETLRSSLFFALK